MNNYFETRNNFDQNGKKVWKTYIRCLQKYFHKSITTQKIEWKYCDFINNISARTKYATDIHSKSEKYCAKDVKFFHSDFTQPVYLDNIIFDVVFASNFLEHFNNAQLKEIFLNLHRHTQKGSRLILLQPNYKYCSADYFDDFTHEKIFSHISLTDFLQYNGFKVMKCIKRFLPLTFKSRIPKSYILTKFYIHSPIRPFAKQMLIIAEKL